MLKFTLYLIYYISISIFYENNKKYLNNKFFSKKSHKIVLTFNLFRVYNINGNYSKHTYVEENDTHVLRELCQLVTHFSSLVMLRFVSLRFSASLCGLEFPKDLHEPEIFFKHVMCHCIQLCAIAAVSLQ